jgi:hypothetical protein
MECTLEKQIIKRSYSSRQSSGRKDKVRLYAYRQSDGTVVTQDPSEGKKSRALSEATRVPKKKHREMNIVEKNHKTAYVRAADKRKDKKIVLVRVYEEENWILMAKQPRYSFKTLRLP